MTMSLRQAPTPALEAATFKDAMRRLVGGVCVITAGAGEERTGLTATSAVSLSVEPPTMIVCVNREASAWPVIHREGHFCVNVLGARHRAVADRFAGRGGVKGRRSLRGRALDAVLHRRARASKTHWRLSTARRRNSSSGTATSSSSAPCRRCKSARAASADLQPRPLSRHRASTDKSRIFR